MHHITPQEFISWIDQQLKERGWSDSGLAQEAKLSSGFMAQMRRGKAPGLKACKAIAGALNVADVFVLRKAGLLEQDPEANDKREQMNRPLAKVG